MTEAQGEPHEIWCIIDGDTLPFAVTAHGKVKVWQLQELIRQKKERRVLRDVDAADLVLWKVDINLSHLNEDFLHRLATTKHDEDAKLMPWDSVSGHWPTPPPDDRLHIFVQRPQALTGVKRNRDRSESPFVVHTRATDITDTLYERWRNAKPTLPPTPVALLAYLDEPLAEADKVPVSDRHLIPLMVSRCDPRYTCSRDDLEQLFIPSEDAEADHIWTILKVAITTCVTASVPDRDAGPMSFHSFWDDNIRKIVGAVITPSKTIRDSRHHTSTLLQRPDFGLLIDGVCVFRGEESVSDFRRCSPKDELFQKLTWTYNPAPYILGYYAVGPKVTLVAISSTGVIDLATADLSYRKQRIKHLIRMIKLCGLLQPLRRIIGHRGFPELQPCIQGSGTKIEIGSTLIKKSFPSPTKVQSLRIIYQLLVSKKVPNVDRIVRAYVDHQVFGSVVYLGPRGINDLPQSSRELRQAVLCILKALAYLHHHPTLLHRDIRWPNVIRDASDRKKWFLVDWDDASVLPTCAELHFDPACHSPHVFSDNHGVQVDLWGVGNLIRDAKTFVPSISEEMLAIGARLVNEDVESALQALDDLGVNFHVVEEPWPKAICF